MRKYYSNFQIESTADMEALSSSLSSLESFKRRKITPTHCTVSVGNKLRLALRGTILNNEYTAPVIITLRRTDTGTDVTIEQNYPLPLYNISSLQEFYDNTTAKVRQLLCTV